MDNQVAIDATKAGHAPANVAGGRRIKGANHVPLKAKDEEKSEDQVQQEEASEEEQRLEKIHDKELERLRREEVAQKLAREQEATQPKHTAWDSNNPKHASNKNVGVQQPRQHNHMTYRPGNVDRS